MLVNKISGLLVAGTLLTGCEGKVFDNAEKYMENKPQKELNQVIGDAKSGQYDVLKMAHVQSRLDSVAFRDVFMTTNASKDSAKVKEFNKLAAKYRVTSALNPEEKLLDSNITSKDFKELDYHKPFTVDYHVRMQYATDSVYYKRFFEKYGLLDKKTRAMFNEVCKQIKP